MRRDVATLVAEYLHADMEAVEKVKLAVSEAATSVVRSVSFENNSRHVHVTVATLGVDRLAIIVSDDGYGVAQPAREPGLSMGFVVMRDCADSLTLTRTPTGGMEIDMRFALGTRGAQLEADASGAAISANRRALIRVLTLPGRDVGTPLRSASGVCADELGHRGGDIRDLGEPRVVSLAGSSLLGFVNAMWIAVNGWRFRCEWL